MRLVDIGVNLMNSAFDNDRETVIEAAQAVGVSPLVITGNNIVSSVAAFEFARNRTSSSYATAGVHPHNATEWNEAAQTALRELVLREPKSGESSGIIVAVGECGLDFNRNFSPPQDQRKCFEDQLALAAETEKPVFLHERDAFDDFFAILKKYRARLPGAVVHCFTGTEAALEAYLSLDCHIGITGWICDERRGGGLVSLLKNIPADRLLLETDSPYLLPRNLPRCERGKSGRNEPRFLPHIAVCAAEILGKKPEQLAEETSANAVRFFGFNQQQ